MAKDKDSKESTQRAILFRYDAEEHPDLDNWLYSQSNRTQSIIFGLEQMITHLDPNEDILKTALRNSIEIEPIEKMSDDDTEGLEQKDVVE